MQPLSVITIHNHRKRRFLGFKTLEEVEMFILYLKKYCPYVTTHLVNHRYGTPPPNGGNRRGLWCPYCAEYREFKKWYNYKKCVICHVSTEDWATKTYNNLWPRSGESKSTKRKRRSEA